MKQFKRILVLLGLFLIMTGAGLVLGEAEDKESPVNHFLLEQNKEFRTGKEQVFPKYLTIEGSDIGGMTLEEVRSWISEYVDQRLSRHVTLMVLGNAYEYEMTGFGINWTNQNLLDELEGYLLKGNFVEQYISQKDMQASPVAMTIDFSIDQEYVRQLVLSYVEHFTCTASNARVQLVDGGFQVTEGVIGRAFDAEAIIAELTAQLTDYSSTDTLVYDFPHTDTSPQYMSDSFNFTFSVLGECTTKDLGEDSRRNNIILSASRINGQVVYPGETFTALTWYGEVTEAGGYRTAPTYQDGQQLPGVGGGICQTTTTLYDALLYAEMGIAYRSPHSMLVAYVPPSMDAMVDYNSKADFVAYNNSEYPIYFEAYVSGDSLTVRVWGNETRPANRTVVYDYRVLEKEFPNPLYEVEAVNDEVCKVGAYYVGEKVYEEVAPHPYVKSQLWKIVTVDGQVTEQYVVQPEHPDGNGGGYDDYRQMKGRIYHASDCVVTNILINDDSAYLKQRVHHDVRFPNGTEWNEYAYRENMGQ